LVLAFDRGPKVPQDVALFYTMGRELAFARTWPAWHEGSEFNAIRAKSEAARR
jgi:aminopeptidase